MSILTVIGHWLIEGFIYKEALLEFVEIEGVKSRENMAGVILELFRELDIEYKLISITSDNATNNETLIDEVDIGLCERFPNSNTDNPTKTLRFHSQDSYIRCIAYILNRIVKTILETLKSRDRKSADDVIELIL